MKRRMFFLFLALALLAMAANAQDSLNVTKIGQLSISGGNAYDVVVSGSYAYIIIYSSSLLVVDVSNPANPVAVGNCPIPFGGSTDLAVSGSYVYVVTGSGLHVINVANPTRPVEVASLTLPGNASGVAVQGSYAFVAAATGGFRVINISNPAAPFELNWISIIGNAYAVAVSGSYAYVTGGPSSIFSVVDIQNPASPSVIGSCLTASAPDFNIAVSGSYAYVSEGGLNLGIDVIDISNPTAPTIVATCPLPGTAQGIDVLDSYAYVAVSGAGLRVVDVSAPSQPFEVGYYNVFNPKDPAALGSCIYLAEGAFFSILQFSPADIAITLAPINPPIQLPASGGTFDYDIVLANQGANPSYFDIWIMVQLPSGSWYGPALGPVPLILPGNFSLTRIRSQSVPGTAPAGAYWYQGRIGDYPTAILDSSGFAFTKLGLGDDVPINDWACAGESFDEPDDGATGPKNIGLICVAPNPFNPVAQIRFDLPQANLVNLKVYNISGRMVADLADGWREAGTHEVTFDASGLAAGIYFARLEAGNYRQVQKMVLLK